MSRYIAEIPAPVFGEDIYQRFEIPDNVVDKIRADSIEEFTKFYKCAVTENSVCKLSKKGVCVHEYCIDCYKDAYLREVKEKQND